jgi:hypothetical protein
VLAGRDPDARAVLHGQREEQVVVAAPLLHRLQRAGRGAARERFNEVLEPTARRVGFYALAIRQAIAELPGRHRQRRARRRRRG